MMSFNEFDLTFLLSVLFEPTQSQDVNDANRSVWPFFSYFFNEDFVNIHRWYSTHNISQLTSLDDYIERMKENQEAIYYIGGESKEALLKYPTIQGLLKRGYEVLLLDDPGDEFCMQHLNEYEKKKLVNVAKGDFKMPTDDETEKKRMKKLKKITFWSLKIWIQSSTPLMKGRTPIVKVVPRPSLPLLAKTYQ